MPTAAIVTCLSSLALLAVGQAALVYVYLRFLAKWRAASPPDQPARWRPAAVILCVRGDDPVLVQCLAGLSQQDYPDYQVHVVLDSADDPAMPTVRRAQAADLRIKIHVLPTIPTERSLKCSALVHAVEQLDGRIKLVAFIDADVVPGRRWLAGLTRPLVDERAASPSDGKRPIAATTGSRWFVPRDQNAGSLARQLFMVAGTVQTYVYSIAWGGSMAIRRDVLFSSGIVERWRTALFDDTMWAGQLARHGWRLASVADVMAPCDEPTTLRAAARWAARQLLDVKMYHGAWPAVLVHAVWSLVAIVGTAGLMCAAVIAGWWTGAAWLIGGLALFGLSYALILAAIARAARPILAHAVAEPLAPLLPARLDRLLVGLVLAHLIYWRGAAWALVTRRMTWRGITYAFDSPQSVGMSQYEPMPAASAAGQSIG